MITKIKYGNAELSMLQVTHDDGTIWHVPANCQTWHRELVDKFLENNPVELYQTSVESQVAKQLEHNAEIEAELREQLLKRVPKYTALRQAAETAKANKQTRAEFKAQADLL